MFPNQAGVLIFQRLIGSHVPAFRELAEQGPAAPRNRGLQASHHAPNLPLPLIRAACRPPQLPKLDLDGPIRNRSLYLFIPVNMRTQTLYRHPTE